jgi:hypothetical protein
MTIYAHTKREGIHRIHGQETWTEVEETPGLIRRRTVTASPWVEERSDCFCCSCNEHYSSSDPACRNHGFAAKRPCETHNLPGSEWDDFGIEGDTEVGTMPESVQAVRRRNAEAWERVTGA